MPNCLLLKNEKLALNEVVTSTHDLFRKREDMDIHLRVPIDEIYVFADKTISSGY
ncbi:MAG: hypothetical protein IPF93_20190 [Saprospiraceae bacterium]|nr:hypothetical protein [Saprospiraceae bacterium]